MISWCAGCNQPSALRSFSLSEQQSHASKVKNSYVLLYGSHRYEQLLLVFVFQWVYYLVFLLGCDMVKQGQTLDQQRIYQRVQLKLR